MVTDRRPRIELFLRQTPHQNAQFISGQALPQIHSGSVPRQPRYTVRLLQGYVMPFHGLCESSVKDMRLSYDSPLSLGLLLRLQWNVPKRETPNEQPHTSPEIDTTGALNEGQHTPSLASTSVKRLPL